MAKSLHDRIEELRKSIPKRDIELVKIDEDTIVDAIVTEVAEEAKVTNDETDKEESEDE